MNFQSRLLTLFLLCIISVSVAQEAQVSTLLIGNAQRFEAIHRLPDGRYLTLDFDNGRIYEVFMDGTLEVLLDTDLNILGGGYDSDSNFYFCDYSNGNVNRLNADGTYETVSTGFGGPIMVLQDLDNPDLFYVSEYDDSKLSTFLLSTGERTEWLEEDGIFFPDGLIYDWNDDILIANFENHQIHRVNQDGEITLFADLGINGDMGYITIVGEYLYVTSLASDKVFRVDQNGNSELIAGSDPNGTDDGPGSSARFRIPNGICSNVNGDTLVVADFDRLRVITGFESVSSGISTIENDTEVVLF
ncbi:MAG: hypothetical protein AAF193_11545, partial [Bacteroidota bacterium]